MADVFNAILAHDLSTLVKLSASAANLQQRDEDGRTPLIAAAGEGLVEGVNALLDNGADITAVDLGGRNAFLTAVAEGHERVVDLLLKRHPTFISSLTKSGNNALHRAAAYGQTRLIPKLVAASAGSLSINARNNEGATPLSRAARWGHADTVSALLTSGADVTVADTSGRTPAMWAHLKGHAAVVGVLTRPAGSTSSSASGGAGGSGGYKPRQSSLGASAVGIAEGSDEDGAGESSVESSRASSFDGEAMMPGSASYLLDASDGIPVGTGTGETILPNPSLAVGAGPGASGAGGDYYQDDYLELGNPMHVEGWMAKQGHIFKTWKNRWFVLEGRRMAYYGKEGAKTPKGLINMIEGTDVIIEERYPKPFCFTIITPTKRFILQAADEDEMAEWIEAIQNNLECVAPESQGGQGGGDDDD